jgi:hypothetical protein
MALDVSSDTSAYMCEVTHPLEGLLGLLLLASSETLRQHTAAQTLLLCGYPFDVLSFAFLARALRCGAACCVVSARVSTLQQARLGDLLV